MKMHKTILTLLLTMLAVIGTTATVAHAEGPVVDEGGGTTQVPGNLNPENVLTGDDLANWNALTGDAREYLKAEALPQLIDEIFDVGDDPTEDDVEYLTIIMVRLFKKGHDALEAQKLLLQTTAKSSTTQDTTSACSYSTSLFSYNNKVAVSHHAQCAHQMASIGASVWLTGPNGYSSGWSHYLRHHKKSASLSRARDEEEGCWNGWGAGSATPENDGPNPSPGAGDDQLEECY